MGSLSKQTRPRVTIELSEEYLKKLDKLAIAMKSSRAKLSKEILLEVLDSLDEVFKEGQTNDQAIRNMYRLSLTKMLQAIDETE